jgi:endoglucanase
MWRSYLIALVLTLTVLGVANFFYDRFPQRGEKVGDRAVFSYRVVLERLWSADKSYILNPQTGRTIDPQRQNITTSEGQSYSMMRAVWMDDKSVFDQVWKWTQDNMQHQDDALFAWLYGTREDGSLGILTKQGGGNSATDADTDIAVALLFAYKRWNEETYLTSAKKIVDSMWERSVGEAGGKLYLAANDLEWAGKSPQIVLNPSYCAPYAYRMFFDLRPDQAWLKIVDTCYELVKPRPGQRLPADWLAVERSTGNVVQAPAPLSANYGYDAMRIPWRLALDWNWFREPRAQAVLAEYTPLGENWKQTSKLASVFQTDGSVAGSEEALAAYGGNMGYFLLNDRQAADRIVHDKLLKAYNPDSSTWKTLPSYYDANWLWFGMALYSNQLTNFYPLPPTSQTYDKSEFSFQPK